VSASPLRLVESTGQAPQQYSALVAVVPHGSGDTDLYPIQHAIEVEKAPLSSWCKQGVGVRIVTTGGVDIAVRLDATTAAKLANDILAELGQVSDVQQSLLASCKELGQRLESNELVNRPEKFGNEYDQPAYDRAQAAIAKAEGRA